MYHQGLVVPFDHIDGLVVHEVAVAFPGVLVDLAENDVRIAVDEGFRVLVGIFLRAGGVPGHDGQAVAEVGVQVRTAQVRRFRRGLPGLHLIQHRFHVADVIHPQLAAFRELEPVFLPIMAAVDLKLVRVHPPLLQRRDQVRHRGHILVEAVLVEDPDPVAGADGVAREEQVLAFQEIDRRSVRMAGDGDRLHLITAQVEDLALVDEAIFVHRELFHQAAEVAFRQRETDILLQEGRQHARVVAVVMGEGDRERFARHALGDERPQRLRGVVGPVDRIGQVNQERFLLAHDQIDVRAVVEVGEFPVGVEFLAGRILVVVILDVVHVLADDGDGVGADFDVFGGAASHQGQGHGKEDVVLFHKEVRY